MKRTVKIMDVSFRYNRWMSTCLHEIADMKTKGEKRSIVLVSQRMNVNVGTGCTKEYPAICLFISGPVITQRSDLVPSRSENIMKPAQSRPLRITEISCAISNSVSNEIKLFR